MSAQVLYPAGILKLMGVQKCAHFTSRRGLDIAVVTLTSAFFGTAVFAFSRFHSAI